MPRRPPLTPEVQQAIIAAVCRPTAAVRRRVLLREVAAQFGVAVCTVSKLVRWHRASVNPPSDPLADPDGTDHDPHAVSLEEFWRIKRENLRYADAILSSPPSGNPVLTG